MEFRCGGRRRVKVGRTGEAEDAMAAGAGTLGRAASRRPGIMAAQLEAGSSIGGIGCGKPGACQSKGDALKDERENENACGELPPPVLRTFRYPIHAGPRLR
jgi:hypothetical protein